MHPFIPHLPPLLSLHCPCTVLAPQKLHEPIRLFDTDLRQLAVGVEDVKEIPLSHFLAAQVADEQARTGWKLLPVALADVATFCVNEAVIFRLCDRVPGSIIRRWGLAGRETCFTEGL